MILVADSDSAALSAPKVLEEESRRLAGVLKFLEYLFTAPEADPLIRAMVNALAIWFDADARVYKQGATGDYVLHTSLPGADIHPSTRRLARTLVGAQPGWIHLDGVSGRFYAMPMAASSPVRWVLTLSSALDAADESVVRMVARVAGARLAELETEWVGEMRGRIVGALTNNGGPWEVACLQLLTTTLEAVGGASGSIWLVNGRDARRLCSVGPARAHQIPMPSAPVANGAEHAVACIVGADVSVCVHALAGEGQELRAESDALFAGITDVLRAWFSGSVPSLRESQAVEQAPMAPPFRERIAEELARAKRFNHGLSLLVVEPGECSGEPAALGVITDSLRGELRASDLLGHVDSRVAALLIETDIEHVDKVASRLARRLADSAAARNFPHATVGHSALAADCETADAMLGYARRRARPIAISGGEQRC